MHFNCEKNVILREISVAHEIISSKNALSVLSNVLLDLSDDSLRICATDLKVSFETRIPVTTRTPGKITVYCDKFLAILRSLPEGEVQFQQKEEESQLLITEGEGIKFTLSSIPAEKYPEIPETKGTTNFFISQKAFIDMIRNTVFAISPDETRYFMNGVFLEKKEGDLVMVATDGRRLSYISVSPEGEIPDFKGVIIPPKVLNLIKKLASGEGNLEMAIMENLMSVKFDSQIITTSLIDGQFPNYARVIPEKQEQEIHINRVELLEALKRVSLLADYKSKRIFLSSEGDKIKLSSDKSEIGEAEEVISGRSDGADATFALNHEYVADPIREMNNEEICIKYTNTERSVTIVPEPESNFFSYNYAHATVEYLGIKSVCFSGFRNLKDAEVDMDSRNVFLIGENGQGKTNFLEALYYLSYGASFRTRNDKDMLCRDSHKMWVSGKVDSEKERSGSLSVNWSDGLKTIKLHGKLVSDRQELVKRMPTIVFVHDDFLFVSGPPERKRWFMDQTLAMYDPSYVLSLRKYRKHLRELNFLLKSHDKTLLDHYCEQLVEVGLDICRWRREVTSRMKTILEPLFSEVSGISDGLSLEYRPSWKEDDSSSSIMDKLRKQRENDLITGSLGSGPHRDRFIFYLCGREFIKIASTGQQRLLSLSLRAAQARFFSESTGRKPILLVDDVLLELDPARRLIFRRNLPEAEQVVYTFLSLEDVGDRSDDSIGYQVKMGEFHQYA